LRYTREVTVRGLGLMLALRTLLFAGFQAAFAVGLAAAGSTSPWEASIAWWPVSATLANFANLAVLARAIRREGTTWRDLFAVRRDGWRRDLRWMVLALVIVTPLAVGPNMGLGILLFGDASVPATMMFRPLPLWAALVVIPLFPLSIALSELPTYYAFAAPRLQAATGARVWPWVLAAGLHAVQHVALPLVFDEAFVVWRLLMFLPFALFMAWLLHRRRTVLPYMMTVHGLLDAQLPIFILLASLGRPVFGG
jgi:hypothetical protein